MQVVDLDLEQGATFYVSLTYEDSTGAPISTDGYWAHMQIRRRAGSEVLIDLRSDGEGDQGITLGGADGMVRIRAGADDTMRVSKRSVYDLHLIKNDDPTEVIRVFGGRINVTKAVTVE